MTNPEGIDPQEDRHDESTCRKLVNRVEMLPAVSVRTSQSTSRVMLAAHEEEGWTIASVGG